MKEITMYSGTGRSFKEVYEEFVISKTAQGVSDATLNNYRYHLKSHHCAVINKEFCRKAKCDSCGFCYESVCYRQLTFPKKQKSCQDACYCSFYLSAEQDEKRFRFIRNNCCRYVLTKSIHSTKSHINGKKKSINNLREKNES